MALTRTLSLALVAAVANGVSLSQTAAGAQNLTITGSLASGGVATFDSPRRVGITSTGNDSGITFTVTGTDRTGRTITEVVTGANAGVASTVNDFATVTKITTSAATASTVTAGTTAVGSTPVWVTDMWANPGSYTFVVTVTGAANYNIEGAVDDFSPFWDLNANRPSWVTVLNGSTGTNQNGTITGPYSLLRLTVTSGTGTVIAKLIQPYNAGS